MDSAIVAAIITDVFSLTSVWLGHHLSVRHKDRHHGDTQKGLNSGNYTHIRKSSDLERFERTASISFVIQIFIYAISIFIGIQDMILGGLSFFGGFILLIFILKIIDPTDND